VESWRTKDQWKKKKEVICNDSQAKRVLFDEVKRYLDGKVLPAYPSPGQRGAVIRDAERRDSSDPPIETSEGGDIGGTFAGAYALEAEDIEPDDGEPLTDLSFSFPDPDDIEEERKESRRENISFAEREKSRIISEAEKRRQARLKRTS